MFALAIGASACSSVGGADPSLWKTTQDPGGTKYRIPSLDETSGGAAGTENGGATGIAGGGGGAAAVSPTGGATSSSAGGALPTAGGGSGAAVVATGGTAGGGGGEGPAGGAWSAAGGSSAGTGGSVSGAGGDTSGTPRTCMFSFDVTTVTAHGWYAPQNAGAVWISDGQNKFVKTLRWWSPKEIGQVTAWVQATGSNKVDAVSGATRTNHGPLNATWNCTDVSGAAVADGSYAVHVSFAEADAPFAPTMQASVPFTKSASGADVMGQDTANFTSMHVKLTEP